MVTISTPLGGAPPASSGVAQPAGGACSFGLSAVRFFEEGAAVIGVGFFAFAPLDFGPAAAAFSAAFAVAAAVLAVEVEGVAVFGFAAAGFLFAGAFALAATLSAAFAVDAAFGLDAVEAFGLEPVAAFGLDAVEAFGLEPVAAFGLDAVEAFGLDADEAFALDAAFGFVADAFALLAAELVALAFAAVFVPLFAVVPVLFARDEDEDALGLDAPPPLALERDGAVFAAAFAAAATVAAASLVAGALSVEPDAALPSASRRPVEGLSPRFRERRTGRERGRLERTSRWLSSAISRSLCRRLGCNRFSPETFIDFNHRIHRLRQPVLGGGDVTLPRPASPREEHHVAGP